MLEKPDLADELLIACLQDSYGLHGVHVTFLPLGADPHTSVYRAVADNGLVYFVKVRSGNFDEISVALPKLLSDQGIAHVIAPLLSQTGQLWAKLDAFTVILYPFVSGQDGYAVAMSDRHWREFGTTFKRLHTLVLPPALAQRIPQESYPAKGREQVKMFLSNLEAVTVDDSVAHKAAALMQSKRDATLDLVMRADRLAQMLQMHPPTCVVCHADIHAGNVLIDCNDHFYIVDWDTAMLAPKEHDLMFIGGGQGFVGHTVQEEESLFYGGYGETQVDPVAIAYYRYERIIQDIAIFCEDLLLTSEGGDDREQSFTYLASNFLPGGTIEVAYLSDKSVRR